MILYMVIARAKDGAVLVESTLGGVEGNFPQITIEVLKRIVSTSDWNSALGTLPSSSSVELLPPGGQRTFVQRHDDGGMFGGLFSGVASPWGCNANADDVESGVMEDTLDYYFHLSRDDNGLICLCISDDVDPRYHTVNFHCLHDAQTKFTSMYSPSKVTKAKSYEMDKTFHKELGKLMHYYNENRNTFARYDKVNSLLNQVDDLTSLLGRNIEMVLERETKLDDLAIKSETLVKDVKVFRKKSVILKKKVRRDYFKWYCVGGIVGLLMIFWTLVGMLARDDSKKDE
eukprot:scaffold43948_cov49-Cyclotella_meneghiniana.AAC.2